MQEAQPLLIFPYNGNGVDVLDSIGSAYRFIGFVDDHNAEGRVDANGYPDPSDCQCVLPVDVGCSRCLNGLRVGSGALMRLGSNVISSVDLPLGSTSVFFKMKQRFQ